ncbi:hypothetical protein ID866_5020 [Astraeus odoratus]|nr:hypothetical protein ID866_5020 [Astraeus odoratus]
MVAYNIVFAGQTGDGKSSLINLLVQLEVAKISNDVRPVDGTNQRYIGIYNSKIYRLWETPGFNEGDDANISTHRTAKALKSFLTKLSSGDGVHLVVYCFKVTHIFSDVMKKIYSSILDCAHSTGAPVVAAVTYADEIKQGTPETWWSETSSQRERLGMQLQHFACVSTLKDNMHPAQDGRRARAREDMWQLISTHAGPLLPTNTLQKEINVILFGETGHGKSSVVNLIVGKNVADVSRNALPCTLNSKKYQIGIGLHRFRIWDTIGFNEPKLSTNDLYSALGKAHELISEVTADGGINLLLFCARAGRITQTMENNYRLFYEVLCEKKVPIAFVLTHLEDEEEMESYWTKNGETFTDAFGTTFGHACITGSPRVREKYDLSRLTVLGLLTDCDSSGKYTMPQDAWLVRVAKGLLLFLRTDERLPKAKRITKALVKRCGFTQADAERLGKQLAEGKVNSS